MDQQQALIVEDMRTACLHTCIHIAAYILAHMHTCTQAHNQTWVDAFMHTCTYTDMQHPYKHTCIPAHVHPTYICMHIVCAPQEEEGEWGVVSSLHGEDAFRGATIIAATTAAVATATTTTTFIIAASLHVPSGC